MPLSPLLSRRKLGWGETGVTKNRPLVSKLAHITQLIGENAAADSAHTGNATINHFIFVELGLLDHLFFEMSYFSSHGIPDSRQTLQGLMELIGKLHL